MLQNETPSTISGLIEILLELRLLTEAQVAALRQNPAVPKDDFKSLLKHLVMEKLLTHFQANYLASGRKQDLVLGPFLFLERLGEGGMGQVFKARHQIMNRVVAVKVLRDQMVHQPDFIRRFMREIQAAAQLSHPNIVTAHDANQVDNRYFFAMEYVEGTDLAKLVKRRGKLEIVEACELIRQAAMGLQHAYERGMVHRDIKPANLLVTTQGVLKILDMGLARVQENLVEAQESNPLTQDGLVMGTPDYMAPEQAMDSHTVDIRADIYSLGCTLYHLLIGQPPYAGGTIGSKIAQHLKGQPPNPSSKREDLPPGLPDIILRMMAYEPAKRYQTPSEVAAALAPFAQIATAATIALVAPEGLSDTETGQGKGTVPPNPFDETVARNEGGDTGTLSAPSVDLTQTNPSKRPALASTLIKWQHKVAGWLQKIPVKKEWKQSRYFPVAVGAGVLLLMLAVIWLWPRRPATVGLPPEDALPWYPRELVAVLGEDRGRHWGPVTCLACTADGTLIASGGNDGMIAFWSPSDLRQKGRILEHTGPIISIAFSPNGKQLVSLSQDRTQRLWNLESLDKPVEVRKFASPADYGDLLFTPDGLAVLTWRSNAGFFQAYEVNTGLPLPPDKLAEYQRKEPFHRSLFWNNTVDPVEKLDTLVIYDRIKSKGDTAWQILKGHPLVEAAQMDVDSFRVVSKGPDGVIFWDGNGGSPLHRIAAAKPPVIKLALAPGGNHVFLADQTGAIQVLAWDSKAEVARFQAHQSGISAFVFPSGAKKTVVTGSADGTLRHWNYETGQEMVPLKGHVLGVQTLAFSPGGDQILTGGADGLARLWTLRKGQVVQEEGIPFRPHSGAVQTVEFVPGSSRLLTVDSQFNARLWENDAAKIHFSFPATWGHYNPYRWRLSPDGKWLATGGGWIHQLGDGQPKDITSGDRNVAFLSLAWSSDNKFLLGGSQFGPLVLWELEKKTPEVRRFGGHTFPVRAVALPGPGRGLSASEDGLVGIWDLAKKFPTSSVQLEGKLPKDIESMNFSPDGALLACAGKDGTILIWDIPSGKVRNEWKMPGAIRQILFAPDNVHLGTANSSGTVYLYRLERSGSQK